MGCTSRGPFQSEKPPPCPAAPAARLLPLNTNITFAKHLLTFCFLVQAFVLFWYKAKTKGGTHPSRLSGDQMLARDFPSTCNSQNAVLCFRTFGALKNVGYPAVTGTAPRASQIVTLASSVVRRVRRFTLSRSVLCLGGKSKGRSPTPPTPAAKTKAQSGIRVTMAEGKSDDRMKAEVALDSAARAACNVRLSLRGRWANSPSKRCSTCFWKM